MMTHHVAPREALVRASWTPVVAVEHAGLLGTYTMCVWMILGVMGCTGGTGRGGGVRHDFLSYTYFPSDHMPSSVLRSGYDGGSRNEPFNSAAGVTFLTAV